ncbi:hypothetical protein CR513_18549, partial [Mucuna pruriens]
MEDHGRIDQMIGRFQTIINNLSLHRQWRSYVTALKAFNDLEKLPKKEFLCTLKGKSIALKAQRAKKGLSSKAFKVEESMKIHSMWKHKGRSRWKNNSRKYTKKVKDKSQVVCYKCKKPGHFKYECPSLEKEKEKKRKDEEAKLCMMTDTASEDEDNKEFVNGYENLKKILKHKRHPYDKIGVGCDKKKDLKKDKSNSHCLNYGNFGNLSYDCREHPKGSSKQTRTNKKGPKRI